MSTFSLDRIPPILLLRWSSRLLALFAFLFWGQFFLHHCVEWLWQPRELPPPFVFGMLLLHLLYLVGLLVGWRYEVVGACWVLAAACSFFLLAAGKNGLPFAFLSSLPAFGWLACARLASRAPAGPR